MSRLSRLLVVGVCLAMLMGPAAAVTATVTATVAIDAPSTVESGETVTVSLTLTNTGESADFYLLNVSVPDSWSVVGHSDDGGEFDSDDVDWLYLSVDAGTSVQPSVTYETAGDTGAVEIEATAENDTGVRDTGSHTITVESGSDSGGGDDDGGDDGSPSSGGGSDDDGSDGSTYSGGGGSDDDGGDGSSTPTPTGGAVTTPGDETAQSPLGDDDDGQPYDGSEVTPERSTPGDVGGATPTGTPADGAAPEQPATDGGPIEAGVGVGLLGMALLTVVALAVVLVQRR